jgi:hypothetical protein
MNRKLSRADINQLHQLGSMKEKGILTADEFAALKSALFDEGRGGGSRRPALWFAGAAAVLLIIAAVADTSSGGSAAHGVDRVVAAAQR